MRNKHATQLIFELSTTGRNGVVLPECDVPTRDVDQLVPASLLQSDCPPLPEVTEPEVIRHITNLSTTSFKISILNLVTKLSLK